MWWLTITDNTQDRCGAMFVLHKQTCYITTLSQQDYTQSCWCRAHDCWLPGSANSYQLQSKHARTTERSGARYWDFTEIEYCESNGESCSIYSSKQEINQIHHTRVFMNTNNPPLLLPMYTCPVKIVLHITFPWNGLNEPATELMGWMSLE